MQGNRLLLEVVSRTSALLSSGNKDAIEQYKKLADEIKVNHPALYILGGIMEILIGAILYLPSIGYSEKIIAHGMAMANTGFFAQGRTQLSQKIMEFASFESEFSPFTYGTEF
ncbi:MAG: hypothetical protein ACRCXC_01895 [Legionella sp.]